MSEEGGNMKDKTEGPPKRRALLQRGAALLGGAIGLGGTAAAASTALPASAEIATGSETLRLFGTRRARSRAGKNARGTTAAPAAFGELALEPGAEPIGSFRSNGLGQAGALPNLPMAALEIQTFELAEGTLFGIGAPLGRDGERICAVLGGTGRFASARGSYLERPAEGASLVEFVFTLKS
jgi:hypothetical protein